MSEQKETSPSDADPFSPLVPSGPSGSFDSSSGAFLSPPSPSICGLRYDSLNRDPNFDISNQSQGPPVGRTIPSRTGSSFDDVTWDTIHLNEYAPIRICSFSLLTLPLLTIRRTPESARTYVFTSWDNLANRLHVRLGVPVRFIGSYLAGTRNILRRLLIDEREYVVRVPLIPNDVRNPNDTSWWSGARRKAFKSELATQIWVKGYTRVATPVIIAMNTRIDPDIGMPWVVMELLPGKRLERLVQKGGLSQKEKIKVLKAAVKVQVVFSPSILVVSFGWALMYV
jgi:hypothetical protein